MEFNGFRKDGNLQWMTVEVVTPVPHMGEAIADCAEMLSQDGWHLMASIAMVGEELAFIHLVFVRSTKDDKGQSKKGVS